MGGVDRQDQQLASFSITRRYTKGYGKIFFYVLDVALYDAYLRSSCEENRKTGKLCRLESGLLRRNYRGDGSARKPETRKAAHRIVCCVPQGAD
ncbi:hypothetical protein HPB47_026393 [Ixodes persulcatus]|uniref:Uncharacterized protein n=1 Tax=Ixodes persulcatus TaxID=34615 RepID=A0AC60PYV9_IXOPE|nr:hypothetical protein HPB47_026393 [Ixodes persulcatus]